MKSDVSMTYGYLFGTVKIGFLENKIKKIHQKFSKIAVMGGWEIFTRLGGSGGGGGGFLLDMVGARNR